MLGTSLDTPSLDTPSLDTPSLDTSSLDTPSLDSTLRSLQWIILWGRSATAPRAKPMSR